MKKLPGKYRLFFQIVCLLLSAMLRGQSPTDSLPPTAVDSTGVNLGKVKISKEGLDEVVEYGAHDSMWFDVKNKRLHLYGQAHVQYTSLDITAGYIMLDYVKNEISAESFPDTAGVAVDYPKFKSADQEFEANKLRFNFKTKKGIIYEARTKQEDLYILGERSKFVGSGTGDSMSRNTIYNQNSLLTTCDELHPHYGIRAKKLKVIPDRMVITGPANLEIEGVPTPLFLPFGFFPISKTRRAGLISPRDFEFARVEGLGIKDFGWYQPISEHMDAKLLFNAYTNGSWGTEGLLRYDHKYHYTGNFDLTYNNRISEDAFANRIKNKSFGLNWTHQQDPKANPTKRFGGSVHIETNRDQNRNRNDYQSVYQNSLSSNLNYSQTFPGKPFSLTAGLSHSQNTQTRIMTISFPNINFTMQRIYPFKRKEGDGTEKWYEKLSLTYNSALQNSVRVPDTLLFTRATLQNARLGIQHRASTDYNFKLFKYIN
ncbi:MAG: putative LPS assembly protein LptD, partial [Saprospiraceae bacterium]